MDLRKMSTRELKELAKSLYESIYVSECYGTENLVELEAVLEELRRRGITAVERLEFEGEEE